MGKIVVLAVAVIVAIAAGIAAIVAKSRKK